MPPGAHQTDSQAQAGPSEDVKALAQLTSLLADMASLDSDGAPSNALVNVALRTRLQAEAQFQQKLLAHQDHMASLESTFADLQTLGRPSDLQDEDAALVRRTTQRLERLTVKTKLELDDATDNWQEAGSIYNQTLRASQLAAFARSQRQADDTDSSISGTADGSELVLADLERPVRAAHVHTADGAAAQEHPLRASPQPQRRPPTPWQRRPDSGSASSDAGRSEESAQLVLAATSDGAAAPARSPRRAEAGSSGSRVELGTLDLARSAQERTLRASPRIRATDSGLGDRSEVGAPHGRHELASDEPSSDASSGHTSPRSGPATEEPAAARQTSDDGAAAAPAHLLRQAAPESPPARRTVGRGQSATATVRPAHAATAEREPTTHAVNKPHKPIPLWIPATTLIISGPACMTVGIFGVVSLAGNATIASTFAAIASAVSWTGLGVAITATVVGVIGLILLAVMSVSVKRSWKRYNGARVAPAPVETISPIASTSAETGPTAAARAPELGETAAHDDAATTTTAQASETPDALALPAFAAALRPIPGEGAAARPPRSTSAPPVLASAPQVLAAAPS